MRLCLWTDTAGWERGRGVTNSSASTDEILELRRTVGEAWQCPDRQSTCWRRRERTAFSGQWPHRQPAETSPASRWQAGWAPAQQLYSLAPALLASSHKERQCTASISAMCRVDIGEESTLMVVRAFPQSKINPGKKTHTTTIVSSFNSFNPHPCLQTPLQHWAAGRLQCLFSTNHFWEAGILLSNVFGPCIVLLRRVDTTSWLAFIPALCRQSTETPGSEHSLGLHCRSAASAKVIPSTPSTLKALCN